MVQEVDMNVFHLCVVAERLLLFLYFRNQEPLEEEEEVEETIK